jgi:sulfur-oxidizing protein SoxX
MINSGGDFNKTCLLRSSLFFSCVLTVTALPESTLAESEITDRIARGKAIAYDRNAGNCLACHMIPDSELPGNVGPPLIQMKSRFPLREDLVAQIRDAGARNPNTVMPPYGRHNILTDDEIDLVVDFIHSI